MSLFQFKVSSLSKQKNGVTNSFLGKSPAPATSSTFGSISNKPEKFEEQASQFFIDDNDLWNDDDENDVFEPDKKKKLEKSISPAKSPKKLEDPIKTLIDESEQFTDHNIDCINESTESHDKTENSECLIDEKEHNDSDFDFTDYRDQKNLESEICFDLVDDDDVLFPDTPDCKKESPKSPTFHLSGKFSKKSSSSSNSSEKKKFESLPDKPRSETISDDLISVSKEQQIPLGLGEDTDLWLNDLLQDEAFSNISSDISEEKLQRNLNFLNKTYVEILEKVMSAFESLPSELLTKFPEFDPNVFITLRTTRRRIKAIVIKTENLLKRKNSIMVDKDCSLIESPATREYSKLSLDDVKPSEGVFAFKQPLKTRNLDNFPLLSPPVQEKKIGLYGKQTTLNFPVLDSPKSDAVEPLKSSTPLAKTTLNSSLIDYTDVLYKTPPKSTKDRNVGRFPASMRNDGFSEEFNGMNFPHSEELQEKFRQKFGLRTFRPNQLQVINAALLGHDCFVLMPTGGGKSLCYQLPALVTRGVTVVVSPLRSLILDQVTKLLTLDISAAHLSGDLNESETGSVYMKLNQPEPRIKLLYVTPEKVGASASLRNCFSGLYKRNMLARFVIDEAHCVSQWGHDFRPDYKKLRELRENYPKVNIMALTATATPRVRTDILHQLKMDNPKWFLSSFNRSNLKYSVQEKKGKSTLKEIAELIQKEFKKDTGVIYCFSRKECEDVAKSLKEYGITAIPYHAGLNDNERTRAQNSWMNDRVKVVCATIAFGMGIDKLDVRFVIHYSLPKSIEGYYQESGRAGRDGEKATCILYYSYRDRIRMLKLINMDQGMSNPAAKKVHIDNLFRVAAFAENKTDCRRALQLEYFGEKFDRKNCIENRSTACDNCLNQGIYETIDVTAESKAIVASVKQVCGTDDKRSSNFTMLHFVDVFKGTVIKKVISEGHDTLPSYGLGKSWQRIDAERLFRKLIMEEFIKERLMVKDDGITFAYIKFGPRGEELLKGNIKITFEVKKRKGSNAAQPIVRTEERVDPSVLEIQEKCYGDLMEAIHEIASSVNCNPNAIMNVQALRAMSSSLPETAEEMLSINHVTTANFEKYGNILLEITKKYSEQKKLLQIAEDVPDDLFVSDPWPQRNSDDSPYFETDITFMGKGRGGKRRKRAPNNRSTKKWKGSSSNNSNSGKASSSRSNRGRGRGAGNGSGVTTVPGAKYATLMELPTNKSRGFARPKVVLKNL